MTGRRSATDRLASRAVRVRSEAGPLCAVALGGGLGALARVAAAQLLPAEDGAFPWSTLLVNVLGCFLMGVVMVLVDRVWPTRRLLRPLLGVGVLGGFTSFSTYVVDFQELAAGGAANAAVGYLVGTVFGALVAVALGGWLTRAVLTWGAGLDGTQDGTL